MRERERERETNRERQREREREDDRERETERDRDGGLLKAHCGDPSSPVLALFIYHQSPPPCVSQKEEQAAHRRTHTE